jgi:hypothetical protein
MRRALAIACLLLAAAGSAEARSLPERPVLGEKPDFHVVAGAGWLGFDFETFGVAGAPDVTGDRWGFILGVDWTWAERLRLGAELGGWQLSPDASCGRVSALALVQVVGGFSLLGSVGATNLTLADDTQLEGVEAGAGAAYVAHLAGPVSLEGRYEFLSQRYFEEEIAGVTIHPDATAHLLSLHLILDF